MKTKNYFWYTCDKHFEDLKINVNYITLDVMVFIKCMDVETVSAYTMYFSSYKIVFYNYMYMSIYANELVNKNFVQNINLYEK